MKPSEQIIDEGKPEFCYNCGLCIDDGECINYGCGKQMTYEDKDFGRSLL